MRLIEIMRAGAQVSFLGHRGSGRDLDFSQIVNIDPATQTGLMAQREVPRDGDSDTLVDKCGAIDFHPK